MDFTLAVTAQDIAKGKPGNGNKCAVALALKYRFPRHDVHTVGAYTWTVESNHARLMSYHGWLPGRERRFKDWALVCAVEPLEPVDIPLQITAVYNQGKRIW